MNSFEDMIHNIHEDAEVQDLLQDDESDAIDSVLHPSKLEKLAQDEDDNVAKGKKVHNVPDEMEELEYLDGMYDAEELEHVEDGLPKEIDDIINTSGDLDPDSPLARAMDDLQHDDNFDDSDDSDLLKSVDDELADIDATINSVEEEE